MTTQTEALKLALEALKRATNYDPVIARAITAIKEALAQPEQEPDVYIPADALRQLKGTSLLILRSVPLYGYRGDGLIPLYTTPPQRKPLDIKTIKRIATYCGEHITDEDVIEITRRVEEEHKIKE